MKNYYQLASSIPWNQETQPEELPWPAWEVYPASVCIRQLRLIAPVSLFSSRPCLCHQINSNTTKQKLKSFNEILNLLMYTHACSSCHWCMKSSIFSHWGCHHLNGTIDFEFWHGSFNPGSFQVAWGDVVEDISNSMLCSQGADPSQLNYLLQGSLS